MTLGEMIMWSVTLQSALFAASGAFIVIVWLIKR